MSFQFSSFFICIFLEDASPRSSPVFGISKKSGPPVGLALILFFRCWSLLCFPLYFLNHCTCPPLYYPFLFPFKPFTVVDLRAHLRYNRNFRIFPNQDSDLKTKSVYSSQPMCLRGQSKVCVQYSLLLLPCFRLVFPLPFCTNLSLCSL